MPELTKIEAAYIAGNYENTTVPIMAKHLKRGPATIYAYLKQQAWSPYKNPDALKRSAVHPFRYMNRKIEAMAVHNKILGAQNKGQII